jgi:hypothetical protein
MITRVYFSIPTYEQPRADSPYGIESVEKRKNVSMRSMFRMTYPAKRTTKVRVSVCLLLNTYGTVQCTDST